MKRRNFLVLGSLLGLSPYIEGKETSSFERSFKKVEETIASVQVHMFPANTKLPSAVQMKTIVFLFDTVNHSSYDRDIRAFVIEGAEELITREKGKFVQMSAAEKEKALRAYEKTSYGSNWLSRIMTLTMEGLFSDPIYGSNVNEAVWKALGAYGGVPRAQKRYISDEV